MPIILKEEVGPQVPTGAHIAICYRIAYIGTQPDSGFGESRKLVIFWELPHERMKFDGVEKPMGLSRIYSLGSSGGMHKKSGLRLDLAAWRGRDFTAEELQKFELKVILGKACQVQVEHNKEGRAKVSRVVGIPKGMTIPPVFNPLVEYSIDDGKNEVYQSLPEWVKKVCDQCLEWNGGKELPKIEHEAPPTDEDDVPF